jgi:hypothetical protein
VRRRGLDPKTDGSRFAYEPIQRYCHGCYLKGIASEDTAANPGLSVELAPTGTPQAARRYLAAPDLRGTGWSSSTGRGRPPSMSGSAPAAGGRGGAA